MSKRIRVVDVLLLTDQDRLQRIFSNFPDISLRIVRSLEGGMRELEDTPPAFLFVQNHLSGVSGELIARHVRGRLKARAPQIVLLCEAPPDGLHLKAPVRTVIDSAADDESLVQAIVEVLDGKSSLRTKRTTLRATTAAADAGSSGHQFFPGAETTPLEKQPKPPLPVQDSPAAAAPPSTSFEALLADTLAPPADETVPLRPVDVESPPTRTDKIVRVERDVVRLEDLPPFKESGAGSKKLLLWLTVPILAIMGIVLFRLGAHIARPREVATDKAPAAVELLLDERDIPSFVPRRSMDRSYGESHPGWERYLTEDLEYKVYHEKGVLTALQVIDRRGKGIAGDQFKAMLAELTGGEKFVTDATEQKQHYLIERGSLSRKARIIIYRRLPEKKIKAFVVYFR